MSRSKRSRKPAPSPTRSATQTMPNPDYLRIITCNLQWGTPAEGWPDVQKANSRTGAFIRGLGERCRSLFKSGSVNTRTQLTEENLRKTALVLKRLKPDVLALQEVDKGQRRSGYLHQARILAQSLHLPYWRIGASYAGQSQVLHRRPLDSELKAESGYGIALLSRWPVKSWHFKRLGRVRARIVWGSDPWKGFSHGFLEGLRDLPDAAKGTGIRFGQMRVLLAARLATPLGTVALGTTHLEIHRPTAASQLRRAWRSLYHLRSESCLLVGDFNLRDYHIDKVLQPLPAEQHPELHAAIPSYPADKPWIALDQLLGNGWELVGEPRALRLPISDHRAVIYDLRPVEAAQ